MENLLFISIMVCNILGALTTSFSSSDEVSGGYAAAEVVPCNFTNERQCSTRKLIVLMKEPATWQEAWRQCINATNGFLGSIESEEEDVFIKDFMILNGIDSAWTSGFYMEEWIWGASGNVIGDKNWGPGYPDRSTNPIYVFRSGFTVYEWRTGSPSEERPFICQSID